MARSLLLLAKVLAVSVVLLRVFGGGRGGGFDGRRAGQKQKVQGAPLRRVCRVAASHVTTSLGLTARTHKWAACSLGSGVACDFAVPVCSTAKATTSKPPIYSTSRFTSSRAHFKRNTRSDLRLDAPDTQLETLLASASCFSRLELTLAPPLIHLDCSTSIQGIVKDKDRLPRDSGHSTPSHHSRPWRQRERPRPWRRRPPMSPLTRPTSSCSCVSAAATRSAAHVTLSSTKGKPSWCVSSNFHGPRTLWSPLTRVVARRRPAPRLRWTGRPPFL